MISDLPPVENLIFYKYQGGFIYLYIDDGNESRVLEDLSGYTSIELLVLDNLGVQINPILNLTNNKITKALPVTLTAPYLPNDREISVTPLDAALLPSYTLQFGSKYLTIAGTLLDDAAIVSDSIKIPVNPINDTILSGVSAELGTIRLFVSEADRQQLWERSDYRLSAKKSTADTEVWLTGTITLSKKGDNCNA
jgi:hypothetical protein